MTRQHSSLFEIRILHTRLFFLSRHNPGIEEGSKKKKEEERNRKRFKVPPDHYLQPLLCQKIEKSFIIFYKLKIY